MLGKNVSPVFLTTNALIVWLLYALVYSMLKINSSTTTFAGYFALVGETALDIVAAILAFNLWRQLRTEKIRFIYLIFCLAFISAAFADSIYNLVLNLFQFRYINPVVVSLFDIPFAIFLFFQAMAWFLILLANRDDSLKRNRISLIPYTILSVLIFSMFIFGFSWKIKYFSIIGIFQLVDTFLEVIGFSLATLCLARAKSSLIRFLAIGYLLIVSSDLIIRYNVVSGYVPYLSMLETTWVLGLVFICLGFFLTGRDENKNYLIYLQ